MQVSSRVGWALSYQSAPGSNGYQVMVSKARFTLPPFMVFSVTS